MANLRTNNLSGEQGQNAYRGSVQFLGGNDALVVPASSDFAYGTGDFTIEAWIWKAGIPAVGETRGIFTQTQSGNDYIVFKVGSTNVIEATFGSTTISTTDKLAVHSWNHVAVSRSSNTVKVFLNGIASSGSTVSTDFSDTTRNPTIGNYTHSYGSLDYNGFISNLRVTKGEALYTADFTPPTTELTADANTVLLCCQDSDNPLKEETGKTITGHGAFEHLNDTELVTNGSGTTTTGWTNANTSTFTVEEGMIKVTRSGGSGPTAYQTITTVTGQQYTVSANIQYVSGNYADLRVYNGSDSSGTLLVFLRSTSSSTDGKKSSTFIAESTSTSLFFTFDDGGNTGKFSQISVKAADRGKQPEVIPPYGVDAGNTFGGPIRQSSEGYVYFPTGRTEERGRGRGFYMLGYFGTPSASSGKRIDYINIQSQGNSIRFGDLTVNRYTMGAGANSTRGLFTGGYQDGLSPDTDVNAIEFITIATEGNAVDFGDRIQVGRAPACASNDTRCVMASAFTPAGYQDTIDFVTIASIGNASDFGDLSTARAGMSMSCNSTTRGIFNGGYQPAPSTIRVNNMEFITFATTGNSQDFGDLTDDSQSTFGGTASSSTRGLIGLGYVHPAVVNSVDFCTIATLGNAQDFGDLSAAKQTYGSCSNSIRGLFLGGQTPSYINNIDMVSIATTGDATDFGDVNVGVTASGAAGSDSHGGLS